MFLDQALTSSSNKLSRRAFLSRSAQAATAFFLAPSLLSGCGSTQADYVFTQNTPGGLPLDSLRARLQGALLEPSSPEFAGAVRPWNLRYWAQPQ